MNASPGDRVVILRTYKGSGDWLKPGAMATVDYLLPDYGKIVCILDEPSGPHTNCCLYDSDYSDHWQLARG